MGQGSVGNTLVLRDVLGDKDELAVGCDQLLTKLLLDHGVGFLQDARTACIDQLLMKL